MVRTLPWLAASDQASKKTPARPRPAKRPRILLDDDSDVQATNSTSTTSSSKRQQHDKAARSSSPGSPQPSRLTGRRTPSSSPPPSAPPIEFMQPSDEKWMMVEDEFNSIASTFTKHLHAEEYKKLKKLAAQKSVKTVAALPRPTDSTTTLSKEAQMRKQAEKKREQMKKAAAKHPGHNEAVGSDEEETPMLFTDRHLAGLMQAPPGARAPKRILHTDNTKSHTRAAAGFTKQEDGSPLRPKERQRLPDLGDFMKSRRPEVKVREHSPTPRPKTTLKREDPLPKRRETPATRRDDDDEDDLDAIVPLRKTSARSQLQYKSSSTKSSSISMAPPLRDKPANLHRESSSTSSQSQKTYPRPALKRESSGAGSPPKKTTFSDSATQSSTRHASLSLTRPAASLATEQNNGEFAFLDLPIARSRLLPTRKGPRYGAGVKQAVIKEEKVVKLEEVPYF